MLEKMDVRFYIRKKSAVGENQILSRFFFKKSRFISLVDIIMDESLIDSNLSDIKCLPWHLISIYSSKLSLSFHYRLQKNCKM